MIELTCPNRTKEMVDGTPHKIIGYSSNGIYVGLVPAMNIHTFFYVSNLKRYHQFDEFVRWRGHLHPFV